MNTQTLIIFILVAICLFLLMVIFFIRKHNAELIEITEQTFENEQRLANKLEMQMKIYKGITKALYSMEG